ncbi:MAG: hypothetical protein U0457_07055 [Candidatus Sericytochromatia bacterium]
MKKILSILTSIIISNSFLIKPSYSAEKIPTDAEEINNILLWSLIPIFMHFSLLANDKDSKLGLTSEFLVGRDKQYTPKWFLMWGVESNMSVVSFKTYYPIIGGKFEGMIQDMGVKIPFFHNKYASIFADTGFSLGRYYREFAWGGYVGLGGSLNLTSNIGFGLEAGYRNLNSTSIINSFTLSANANYEF